MNVLMSILIKVMLRMIRIGEIVKYLIFGVLKLFIWGFCRIVLYVSAVSCFCDFVG